MNHEHFHELLETFADYPDSKALKISLGALREACARESELRAALQGVMDALGGECFDWGPACAAIAKASS
jgi:hypothetical protein